VSHDELLDLVAVYALGAVSEEEARNISAHIATCDECRAEYERLKLPADAVALSIDDRLDEAGNVRMKARLMQTVDATTPLRRRVAPAYAILTGLALAAAIVMGVFSFQNERRLNEQQFAGGHVYRVAGGEILKTPQRVYIVMWKLPALPPNRVYQAWTLAPGAKSVSPSLTFVPDANGYAFVPLPQKAASVSAVAISVEPAGGSRAPTTKPLFVRPLT
jgi:anti-sigma-K factor RskA